MPFPVSLEGSQLGQRLWLLLAFSSPGFVNLGTIDILGWVTLCWEQGGAILCVVFIPSLTSVH